MRRNLSMDPILSHYNTKIEERGCFRYINIGTEGIGGRAGRLWLWNIHGFLERMKSQTLNITAHQSEGIKKKMAMALWCCFPNGTKDHCTLCPIGPMPTQNRVNNMASLIKQWGFMHRTHRLHISPALKLAKNNNYYSFPTASERKK